MMRWIISGQLVAESQVAIHTGATEHAFPAGVSDEEVNELQPSGSSDDLTIPAQGIELDVTGRPFLTATAIKGLLRAQACHCIATDNAAFITRLFGDLPQPVPGSDNLSPTGGLIEFRNAWMVQGQEIIPRPALRGKTEVSEGTRTADDGQLRHDRVIAPGSRFTIELVLTRAEERDAALLLSLLSRLDGQSSDSAIGSSTSQGDGRIRWEAGKILRFGAAEAKEWLLAGPQELWISFATETEVQNADLAFDVGAALQFQVEIQIAGHFLISANDHYTDDEGNERPVRRPYRLHSNDKSTARLTGSSLDGALRAQARRIYRTMSGDAMPWAPNDTQLPPAMESLFGSAKNASLLEPEMLVSANLHLVRHEFVAIERFSGGQAEGKKFALEAFEKPKLAGKLTLRLFKNVDPQLTGKAMPQTANSVLPSAVGLLALLLKDLATGDIPVGHATRKGYGDVKQVNFSNQDWKAALIELGETILRHAATVPGFEVFAGLSGDAVLRRAVELLEKEATDWAAQGRATNGAVA